MENFSREIIVSNYYKGELIALSTKIVVSILFVGLGILSWHYWGGNYPLLFHLAKNISGLFGIVILKSLYQVIEYNSRRKKILRATIIDSVELDYIHVREAILTNHRRFHVYFILFCAIGMSVIYFLTPSLKSYLGLFIALFLLSGMLLTFSLFNSFRLSEYKRLFKKL